MTWAEIKEIVNFAGLVLDFFGFVLLLREWWVAFLTQQRELVILQRRFRQEEIDRMQSQHAGESLRKHLSTIRHVRDRTETQTEIEELSEQLKSRRVLFLVAALCISVGFILQIVASIPLSWPFLN
mmetsp:Transcript_19506/g.29346  ORF Transcript_19506/g.29346 Transcript_19506/m.29346 type:complete len:126 (+) Transcript_19506:89-466(+)